MSPKLRLRQTLAGPISDSQGTGSFRIGLPFSSIDLSSFILYNDLQILLPALLAT
jgi:hypothetical protein